MERKTLVSYDARSLRGWGLTLSERDAMNPARVRAAIDKSNAESKENDNALEQFAIYRVTTDITSDGSGVVSVSTFRDRIEIYPAEPDPTPRYTVKKHDGQTPHIASSFDPVKAVRICENFPGSRVEDNNGTVIYRCQKPFRT